MKNKKGQTGETLTWIVATIIIIVLLAFFLFGSSLLGKTKIITNKFRETLTSKQTFEGSDLFLKKSLFTYTSLGTGSDKTSIDRFLYNLSLQGYFNLNYNSTRDEIVKMYLKK